MTRALSSWAKDKLHVIFGDGTEANLFLAEGLGKNKVGCELFLSLFLLWSHITLVGTDEGE